MLSRALRGNTPRKSLARSIHPNLRRYPLIPCIRCISNASNPSDSQSRDINRSPKTTAIISTSRSLSTAADSHNFTPDSVVPLFNSSPWTQPSSFPLTDSQWPAIPGGLLLLDDLGLMDEKSGLSCTNVNELLKNLTACLLVGQYDRSEAIIRKMAVSGCDITILNDANNSYIRGLLNALYNHTEGIVVQRIQRWLEVEMRQLEITPNATTFALVCRSMFTHINIKFRERMLRRYLYMAESMGMLDGAMASGEYSSYEWNVLCRIRADIFGDMPEAEEQVTAKKDQAEEKQPFEIKPTLQKGLGLTTLTHGMRALRISEVPAQKLDDEALERLQIQLESDMIEAEVERWESEHSKMMKMGINPALSRKSMEATLWHWKGQLENQITAHIESLRKSGDRDAWFRGHGQYLEQIPAVKLAAITIMGTLGVLHRSGLEQGASARVVVDHIGSCLELETMSQNRKSIKDNSARFYIQRDRWNKLSAKIYQKYTGKESSTSEKVLGDATNKMIQSSKLEWTQKARVTVSALLLSKFIDIALYPEDKKADSKEFTTGVTRVPAFWHELVWHHGKSKGTIMISKSFKEKLIGLPPIYQNNATQLPMVAKPEPWKEFRGAYLRVPANVMRMKDTYGLQDIYIHAAMENGDMDQVLAALNVLGQTSWRIHQPLLKVMIDVWNTGEALTNFPPANPEMDYPPEPDESAEYDVKRKWRYQVGQLNNIKSGYQSNRCYINLQLEVALAYSNYDLYFPHNLDFRGRAYPVPGILNHMGADHARSLFMFAKGKELGPDGLDWLKVHVANKFGFDKASLEDRKKFATDHIKEIRDSVANPLTGDRWWLQAEAPWQTLATCMELVNALDSPDPAKFVTHLPIHQDGTCNGLQHYAALGGDILGAAQVNLVPGDKPADIYSEVANLVNIETQKDAADGVAIAKALEGLITRKVVKRPVMTNVYGVTFVGAIEQVKKVLDEIIPFNPDAEFSNRTMAVYIARNIFKVFGNMFAGASRIQLWLAQCGEIIATSVSSEQIEKARIILETKRINPVTKRKRPQPIALQSAVVWTTPLKLPVVQPYRKPKLRVVTTPLQSMKMKAPAASVTVLKRKQKAAFPPNFIHSLDATHMMLSAVKCHDVGLSFAAVHDSFWTHAGDVPRMNAILRDAFVHMHSEDIITRLSEEFKQRYKNFLCVRLVPSASVLGIKIKSMRSQKRKRGGAIVGLPSLHELVAEYDRLRLLQSEDPEERKRGEEMVTPGSLLSALEPDSPDLAIPETEIIESIEESLSPDASHSEQIEATNTERLVVDATENPQSDATVNDTIDTTLEESGANPKAKPVKQKKRINYIKIWAATEFPAVPKRGDFDVSMLKKSDYFFS
jgi:DNA-directed RNA polymerase, mitochondrial